MNAAAAAIAVAVTFTWLGMVLAISFLEAPLKFRAPGVTIPIGLGIGRIVFRALNLAEVILAMAVTCDVLAGSPPGTVLDFMAAADVLLLTQVTAIRRPLNRRTDQVLALIGLGVSVLAR